MKTAKTLIKVLESAYANLENNRVLINSLNVFPVPDGDTGDNMCVTFKSGLDKIKNSESESERELIAEFSLACLMGARGNSGVILSLAIKGFADAAKSESDSASILVDGFKKAVEFCYGGVSSPKEGTALTVLRACADKAAKTAAVTKDKVKIFSAAYVTATATVSKTKELLPELKQANVVDAGAKGIACLMEGARLVLEENKAYEINGHKSEVTAPVLKAAKIGNKYCCECVIKGEPVSSSEVEKLGDSVITASSDKIVKLHVHSNFPEEVLKLALSKGEVVNVKIENMQFQHNSAEWGIRKAYGFVAASAGEGMTECLNQLGCDEVITSKEKVSSGEVLAAIERLNAETVFLLPNDKNNILAFEQAAKKAKANCVTIKSEDTAQGINVMMSFDGELSESENTENMLKALKNVKTCRICVADKDFGKVKKGDAIGVVNDRIEFRAKDTFACLEKAIEKLGGKDYNDIYIFSGEAVSDETQERLRKLLSKKRDLGQIKLLRGNQNIYDYIISVN